MKLKWTMLLVFAPFLMGCNNDGSFHVPIFGGTDNSLSPGQRANLEWLQTSVCGASYGAAAEDCRQQIRDPKNQVPTGETFGAWSNGHFDTVTVYP